MYYRKTRFCEHRCSVVTYYTEGAKYGARLLPFLSSRSLAFVFSTESGFSFRILLNTVFQTDAVNQSRLRDLNLHVCDSMLPL